MSGPIQSIERAAAVLQLLGAAHTPLALSELTDALGLPKPTVHGIVRTLCDVGFVDQDTRTGRYRLGAGLARLGQGAIDANELRSRSMNWADTLAARTGLEVQIAMPVEGTAEIVHHVFRPDDSHQRLRVGERHPLHATALGHVLLACVASAPALRSLTLTRYTSSTVTEHDQLAERVSRVRLHGSATENGEHRPGVAAFAAPIRHRAGLGVAALAVVGPAERVLDSSGRPLRRVLEQTTEAAAAIIARLEETH
ncbi:IclR family transcriptional regulator [Nocardioides pacificus]